MKYDFSEITNLLGVTNVYTSNFPKPLLKNALLDSKLPENSEVNYLWKKYNSNEALLITSDFISYINENKYPIIFHFHKISRVYFSPDSTFYLYDLKGERCGTIPARFFGLESKSQNTELNRDVIKDFFNSRISKGNFKYDIDKIYEFAINEIEELGDINEIEKLDEIVKEEYANKIIIIYDDFINIHGTDEIYYRLELFFAIALSLKNENSEALKVIDNVIDNYSEDADLEFWYSIKAEILENVNKIYDSIIYFKKAYALSTNTHSKLEYKKRIGTLSENYNEKFIELPFSERKIILISNELTETPSNSFIVLDRNNLPKKLVFPNTYAKNNELYIAHPYIKESYLSFPAYEANLSSDKFDEFFYFVQCLGAKKITYKIIKGNTTNQNRNQNLNADGSLSIGKAPIKNKGNASIEKENQLSSHQETSNTRAKTQIFHPKKAPYIPNDLIWYPNEQTWHRLYQQRINGQISNYHETISSKDSFSISELEKVNLKLAFKNFFIEADVNISHQIEENFNQNESIEWEIEIEFESLENLNETHILIDSTDMINELASNVEKEYIDEVKYILEDDGIIDNKQRLFLERFREKKGISKDRANKLENELNYVESLNDNEKEYLEEFKEFLNDGEITEKERRILNRFANRLEITNERVFEIENIAK